MGPEILSEIEWEARRVAAAFGLNGFERMRREELRRYNKYSGIYGEVVISWRIDSNRLDAIQISAVAKDDLPKIDFLLRVDNWKLHRKAYFGEHLARGFYCLGFEGESVLAQLPPLSAHEKLELRLSMPREFWPQKWLDEEAEQSALTE